MKKFIFSLVVFFAFVFHVNAQILCIHCYDQNAALNPGAVNKVVNGSFENYTGTNYFCPNSSFYNLDFANWTCTGGGSSTYAQLAQASWVYIAQGSAAAYLGNAFCNMCTATNGDISCLITDSCVYDGVQPGYPYNGPAYGGTTGVTLSQTVNGLTAGSIYILELWSGGEDGFTDNGLFGVDIGFGNTYFSCHETPAITGVGRRYMIVFKATSTSHTIKITNWGHICGTCTELLLDDVWLYNYAEAITTPVFCVIGPQTQTTYLDTAFCEGQSYSYNGHTYTAAGTYVDSVAVDSMNTHVQITTITTLTCTGDISIPNAFSPNGDGKNDIFHILGFPNSVNYLTMKIFNRWGQLVFESNDEHKGWDGTYKGIPQEIGVYVFLLNYQLSTTGEIKSVKGNVTLIR